MSDIQCGRTVDFVHPVQAVIPGAQGRVFAVFAQTTAALNLGSLARLAGVSVTQASRVMPGLVDLGLVERREIPPSSRFRLVRENVAAQAIIDLARTVLMTPRSTDHHCHPSSWTGRPGPIQAGINGSVMMRLDRKFANILDGSTS